jgi:hypothetical protein
MPCIVASLVGFYWPSLLFTKPIELRPKRLILLQHPDSGAMPSGDQPGRTDVDARKVNIHQLCPRDRVKGRLLMASIHGLGNQVWGHTRESVLVDQAVQVGKYHHH